VNIGGFYGKILRVNLTKQKYNIEEVKESILENYLGGRGLGAKILYDEVLNNVTPLSAENKLIFSPGPLTGTKFPTSARAVVVTKSPLTGAYLYSMAGGKFGFNIKKAGFDSIIIEGKSEKPIYLLITDNSVEFKDASHLWGMKTTLALYHLKEFLGTGVSIVVNGPAGENHVKMAGLMTDDWRQFGRGGSGAVLGFKNVKAIAITGKEKVNVYDEKSFSENLKDIYGLLKKYPGGSPGFRRYGSGENLAETRSDFGLLPTKNWTYCTFDGAWDISMMSMRDEKKMILKDQGCFGCPLQCGKLTKSVSADFPSYFCDGPEYETLYSLGSNCMINDPNFIVAANMLCDELGLDTMSTGVVISFAMECIEKGLLTESDFNGRKIKFGSTQNILGLIEDIANRSGIGELLGNGVKFASEKIAQGSDRFAIHVKGMELGGYEPRTAKGQSIVFAVGNRGGCHHSIGLSAIAEVNRGIGQEIEGKGKLVKTFSRIRILSDSTTHCTSAFSRSFDYEIWSRIMHSVTGFDYYPLKLQDIGDRINSIERQYNLQQGFTIKDDTLPKRLLEEKLPDGPYKGEVVTVEQLNTMRTEYFNEMGWDENGIPAEQTLKRLKLM